MFDRQSLHIALLLWGCIFCLIAALCMFMSRNFNREKRKWLLLLLLAGGSLLLSDALAWGYRGRPGAFSREMVYLSNFLVFVFSDVLLFLFHGYVCCCLFSEEERRKRVLGYPLFRCRGVFWIGISGVLLVVISQFTHFYYYIDGNNYYHRNPGYPVSLLLPMLGMLLDLSLMIQFRKKISKRLLVSMISYIVLPFLAAVVLLFYYGISLINIAISISMILMFVVAMIEQNENLARKEQEAADLRISVMLSQIAPHFIYNALTTISELCEKDPVMAKETVGEFSGYLRGNLDSLSEKEEIPFEKELHHVQCYLAIEKKRFGERVQVQYDIGTADFMLPALTLQPIVENGVKHGICRKKGGGTILIRTEKNKENVLITVQDDGAGFDSSGIFTDGRKHTGLQNVADRVKAMCGGSMKVTSALGEGTKVEIFLPNRG